MSTEKSYSQIPIGEEITRDLGANTSPEERNAYLKEHILSWIKDISIEKSIQGIHRLMEELPVPPGIQTEVDLILGSYARSAMNGDCDLNQYLKKIRKILADSVSHYVTTDEYLMYSHANENVGILRA